MHCTLQPLFGDAEFVAPTQGMEWDQSAEMDSVLLSVQNFIDQVESGGGYCTM